MRKLLCIVFLFSCIQASACLNIFAIDSSGRVHYLEHTFHFSLEFNHKEISKRIESLEKEFQDKQYSYERISNYGSYLLMAGYFNEGLDIFRALSKKYDTVYQINANIAVAYELNGNIDSALYWEKLALQIKPHAHNRSEWIHLKILEAKKKILSEADWCLQNNLTGIKKYISENYSFSLHEINFEHTQRIKEFIEQLNERFPFTFPEDKATGKVIFELGEAYEPISLYRSYYCYAIAKHIYPSLAEKADQKMSWIKKIYPKTHYTTQYNTIQPVPEKLKGISQKEMKLPGDAELSRFIKKLSDRTLLRQLKPKTINLNDILKNI